MTAKRQSPADEPKKPRISRKYRKRFRKLQRCLKTAWKKAAESDAKRRVERHYSLTDWDAFNELLKLFGENYFHSITKLNTRGANWETITRHATPPRNLLALYQDKNLSVGLRFNGMTWVLVLDLDRYSDYHPYQNEKEFDRLLGVLENIGLVGIEPVRSSDSEGIHLYIALPEPVPSWCAAHTLHVTLANAGFRVAKGQLEIFPNRKNWSEKTVIKYHGLRLPLQPNSGSVVLDRMTLTPVHNDLNTFVQHLKFHAQRQDMSAFKRAMKAAYEGFTIGANGYVKGAYGRDIAGWYNDLIVRLSPGWTGDGQTNDLIPEAVKLAYVFQGLDGEELVSKTAAYLRQLPGYERYCGHHHNLEKRIRDWLKTIKNLGYYPYTGEFRPRNGIHYGTAVAENRQWEDGRKHNKANQEKKQSARDKLAAVLRLIRQETRQGLVSLQTTFKGVLGVVIDTAKKHFGQGFSMQSLYTYKNSLTRLSEFIKRTIRKINDSVAPSAPEEPKLLPNEISAPKTPKTHDKPRVQAKNLENAKSPEPKILTNTRVTGFLPNNEGCDKLLPPAGAMLSELRTQTAQMWRNRGVVLQYVGNVIHVLADVINPPSKRERRRMITLRPGVLVQLTQDLHSMESLYGFVYIKPLDQEWFIPVLMDYLRLIF